MRRHTYRLLFVLLILPVFALHADVGMQLIPTSGAVYGPPGGTGGWGVVLTGDPVYYAVITSVQESGITPPSSFEDLLTPYLANNLLAIGPGTTLTLPFDEALGTGLGEVHISPGAPPGAQDIGTLMITYDLYDADPFAGPANYTGSGDASRSFELNVIGGTAAIPEPSTLMLLGTALAVLAGARLRRG